MDRVIASAVFITANIWGLYSQIPFTNIRPCNSFWDRTLGSFQLASTVYTLEQVQPFLISANVDFFPEVVVGNSSSDALQYFLECIRNTTIDPTPIPTSITSAIDPSSPSFALELPFPISDESQPPIPASRLGVHQDFLLKDFILTTLVVILGLAVRQNIKQVEETRDNRIFMTEVATNIQRILYNIGAGLQDTFRAFSNEIRGAAHDMRDEIRADLRNHEHRIHNDARGQDDIFESIQNLREDLQEKIRGHSFFVEKETQTLGNGIRMNVQNLKDDFRAEICTVNSRLEQLANNQATTSQHISNVPQELQQIHLAIERLGTCVNVLQHQRSVQRAFETSNPDGHDLPYERSNECPKRVDQNVEDITASPNVCIHYGFASQTVEIPADIASEGAAEPRTRTSELAAESKRTTKTATGKYARNRDEAASSKALRNGNVGSSSAGGVVNHLG